MLVSLFTVRQRPMLLLFLSLLGCIFSRFQPQLLVTNNLIGCSPVYRPRRFHTLLRRLLFTRRSTTMARMVAHSLFSDLGLYIVMTSVAAILKDSRSEEHTSELQSHSDL